MSQCPLRFAIFGNEYKLKKSVSLQKILYCLAQRKATVVIDRTFYASLQDHVEDLSMVSGVFDGDDFEADYVISMGGDGTFLKAANRVGSKGTPIIGVNMGRLGFLADVLPSEISEAIDEVFAGQMKIEEHSVIQVEADGRPLGASPYALNDIAVLKKDDASMISIRTSIDGEYLITYQADGLIVSTPTGSTAYSLSNGGPIMVPSAKIVCITPVAPHSLNIRPIVINDSNRIELDVESRSHNFLVAIDGRSETLAEGTRLTISRAPYNVKIAKRKSQRYASTLREKLMWGADQR